MSFNKFGTNKSATRYFISKLAGENLVPKDIPSDELSALNDVSAIYVYCSKDLKTYYIGQTNSIIRRHGEHVKELEGDILKYEKYFCEGHIAIFYGNEISSNLNYIEQSLIKLFKEFGAIYDFSIFNGPEGNKSDFIQDKRESLDVEIIHKILCSLKDHDLLNKEINTQIKSLNSLLYRHSPFYELDKKQVEILETVLQSSNIYCQKEDSFSTFIIRGGAGTGKTVLMNHIIAQFFGKNIFLKNGHDKTLKIGVCLKSNMIKPITTIFQSYGKSLKENNIFIGKWMDILLEGEKEEFDYILVDESHRLMQYKNNIFPEIHKQFLKKRKKENVLNLILACSKRTVLFYDDIQRIRPNDIEAIDCEDSYNPIYNFVNSSVYDERLSIQYRIKINADLKNYNRRYAKNYVDYLKYILQLSKKPPQNVDFLETNYFQIVDKMEEVKEYIECKREVFPYKNARVVAGYSRKDRWSGKKGTPNRKIEVKAWSEIDMAWNKDYKSWASVDSEKNRNQVGAIHSVQGYDFDYIGLIIGNDMTCTDGKITVKIKNYKDDRGKIKLKCDELEKYIKNVYYTLLTRGIYGIRVFIEDSDLKKYWEDMNNTLIRASQNKRL
ncbi:DNA/RNA helicase domain-containing protein [Candidatus Enterococcus lemimoniae]|uniref:AAA+ ATPase domain-containing protein n=1 Tax=Candidatus Enterococcus lemimoniae TaxID=1834167 RepID=A0ABZ2TAU9_9ENTE